MALTIARVADSETTMGKLRVNFYDVTFDSAYPTGGEAFDEDTIGGKMYKKITGVAVVGQDLDAITYIVGWNPATKKLVVAYPFPETAASGDPETLGPGAGEEVANDGDLSAVSIRVMVVGY